jgi:hypothetical protein
MRSHRLSYLPLICCALLISSLPCEALRPEYAEPFEFWLQQGVKANYDYVWGASDPDQLVYDTKKKQKRRGLDCSGYIYWAARKAAIPGVRRVSASDMARGLGGWVGDDLAFGDGMLKIQPLDLAFWTFDPKRANGHVGAFGINPATGFPGVRHASGSRGVRMDEVWGWVQRDLTKVRRLTIGDK